MSTHNICLMEKEEKYHYFLMKKAPYLELCSEGALWPVKLCRSIQFLLLYL